MDRSKTKPKTGDARKVKALKSAMQDAPDNLNFMGYVEQEELRDAYCGADVFAFMSKEETERIVVLEALASGIPTIVRDIPVYDGWLAHGENVYKADSVAAFSYFISGLLHETMPNLSRAGRFVAGKHSFRFIGKRLKEIYQAEGF